MTAAAAAPRRGRRLRRWLAAILLGLLALHGAVTATGHSLSVPFDVVINLWPAPAAGELAVPADGKRRLVVLQHGLWRSPWALGRVERALVAAGYEVLNPAYPSTAGRLEEFAASLHGSIEAAWTRDGRPVDELSFVAHSMGGLVVEEYLRRPDARAPSACVFVAVPHRGAILADLRKHWWLFRLVMGTGAAMQLGQGDPFHTQPIVMPCPAGVIIGTLGEGNASIPGTDDGTVATGEATFSGATDAVTLPLGHTRIAVADASIHQILHFLRRRAFDHD